MFESIQYKRIPFKMMYDFQLFVIQIKICDAFVFRPLYRNQTKRSGIQMHSV